MKKAGLFALVLILLSSFVYALNVTLVSPDDKAIYTNPGFINFKCSATGLNIIQFQIYSNMYGEFKKIAQKEGSYLSSNEVYQFSIFNSDNKFSNGKFEWNCKAVSDAEGVAWASKNRTFEIQIINDAPVCNGTFPQINLQKNTPQLNVLNLNNYIVDPNKDPLNFSFSGNNNVDITLKDNGFIDLSPKLDRVATDSIYIRSTDGKSSDVQCGPLTVNIASTGSGNTNTTNGTTGPPPTNTPPDISPAIPEQTKEKSVSFWQIDLDDYAKDDSGVSGLNWTVENVGNDIVRITINSINHEVKFEPIGIGSDTVRFVVKDSAGLSEEQNVKITITEPGQNNTNETEPEENEENLGIIKITSHTPGSNDPAMEEGNSLNFSVEVNEAEYDVVWYINGVQTEELSNKFKFVPEKSGEYVVSVIVSKEEADDSYEWEVKVVGKISEEEETNETSIEAAANLCGNNEENEGETCDSCPEDVKCEEGEECINNECIVKNKITGFSIKELKGGSLIGAVIVGIVVVLFIIIMIIRTKNLRHAKSKDRKLSSFEPKIKEIKPREEHILKTIEKEKSNLPSGVEHVIGFIQSGLASGDDDRTIKKALINSGWNRKQIKQAFNSIKK